MLFLHGFTARDLTHALLDVNIIGYPIQKTRKAMTSKLGSKTPSLILKKNYTN